MSPATLLSFGALVALEVLGPGSAWAVGCSKVERDIIARQQERVQQQTLAAMRQNRMPDVAAMQGEAAMVNSQLSPSCLQALQQTRTVTPQPVYRSAPPPSYYRDGNGTTVIPGVGGCGATGCYVR